MKIHIFEGLIVVFWVRDKHWIAGTVHTFTDTMAILRAHAFFKDNTYYLRPLTDLRAIPPDAEKLIYYCSRPLKSKPKALA